MTRRNYYALALWLPLLWPVIIAFGEIFLHSFTWHQMSKLSGVIILAGLFGGIQYVFFAVITTLIFAKRATDDIARAMWYLPTVFAPICAVGLWLFFFFISLKTSQMQVRTSDASPVDMYGAIGNVAMFTLMFGYGYATLLSGILWVLERFGLVRE